MPHLCELLPDICLTTEEKARRNLSQGSRRMPVGMMKTEYTEQSIHNNKNYITVRIIISVVTIPCSVDHSYYIILSFLFQILGICVYTHKTSTCGYK